MWLVVTEEAIASGWLQSTVTKTDVTLRCVFVVDCCIACFLCAMHVFEVQTSSSSPRLAVFVSFVTSIAELAHREKARTHINQSITQLIWCPGNWSFRLGIELLHDLISICEHCNALVFVLAVQCSAWLVLWWLTYLCINHKQCISLCDICDCVQAKESTRHDRGLVSIT